MEQRITDDIDKLKQILPPSINQALDAYGNTDDLLEVVLDLGRVPTARYVEGEYPLADIEATFDDINQVTEALGDFDADNRAGLERSLHRISAIRNRQGMIVGLTCRVGRAVYGTITIIEDLIEAGQNILLVGPPGVGKTTMLREAARVRSEDKRVVIVDTSNEIGGDGDVPHPAVGKARRMQVSHPERQHEVMIEAVENHNPEVIVIDEIGRELEAMAARTIAERGVQLIGTAHGNTLENLLMNPTLSDLVGGIESVTLSDDEARRRGTQKTVLERRSPPTFDILIEIQTRDKLVVHEDVGVAVDGILRRHTVSAEIRIRESSGEIHISSYETEPETSSNNGRNGRVRMVRGNQGTPNADFPSGEHTPPNNLQPITVYAYGIARNRLQQAGKRLHVPLGITDDFGQADAIVTTKTYYRRRPRLIVDAERGGMPIYVLRANTVSQMENLLIDLFKLGGRGEQSPFGEAMLETESAIMRIRTGERTIDLTPQASHIRKRQHQMARRAQLESTSQGKEPRRFVRIFHRGA